jgi:hypothetical protein
MIAQSMQAAPQAVPPQAPAQPPAQGGDPSKRIVTAALMLLNQDAFEKQIIAMIQGAQDPAQGIAQAFVFVLRALHEKSNGMPMQALGQAGQPILQEILKLAEAAKVIQISPELLQAVMQAVKSALSGQGASGVAPAAPATPAPAAQPAPAAPMQPQGV